MREILCNESNPSLVKIAHLTGHKVTGFRTVAGGILMCKLDGVPIRATEARVKVLAGYGTEFVFINHLGYPIEFANRR